MRHPRSRPSTRLRGPGRRGKGADPQPPRHRGRAAPAVWQLRTRRRCPTRRCSRRVPSSPSAGCRAEECRRGPSRLVAVPASPRRARRWSAGRARRAASRLAPELRAEAGGRVRHGRSPTGCPLRRGARRRTLRPRPRHRSDARAPGRVAPAASRPVTATGQHLWRDLRRRQAARGQGRRGRVGVGRARAASAVANSRRVASNRPAWKLTSAAAKARSASRAGSAVSSTARFRKAAAAAMPPRAWARPAERSSSAATSSSGPGAAHARCQARRSGSVSASVASARARCTRWRS